MLLDFQVENYRSYYQPRRFSLVASRQEELPYHLVEVEGVGLRVLRSAVLYGANASGKSNLLDAFWFLGDLLRHGPDAFGPPGLIRPPVFALVPAAVEQPTRFEINFVAREREGTGYTRFEYGLGVHAGRVQEEWLNAYPPGGRRQRWFVREPAEGPVARIRFSTSLQGEHKRLKRVTPANAPYLWVAEKFGHPQLSLPARWLQANLVNRFEFFYWMTAARCNEDPSLLAWVSAFLRCADLGIVGVKVGRREIGPDDQIAKLPTELRSLARYLRYDVSFTHSVPAGQPVALKMSEESAGTQRLFELLGPVALALREGQVVFIDEMSASMHPLLTQRLIEAFYDPTVNTKRAQLVLTTHDVSLLRGELFRRDQVWFTEKTPQGETDLYSLHDFQPRPDASLEKNYLAGRYGAIPYLGPFDFGITDGPAQTRPRRRTKERQADEGTAQARQAQLTAIPARWSSA